MLFTTSDIAATLGGSLLAVVDVHGCVPIASIVDDTEWCGSCIA